MKILHVIATVDPKSGGPVQGLILQESIAQKLRLVESREVISLDLPDAEFLKTFPHPITALGEPRENKGFAKRFLNHYGYSKRLIPWLKENSRRFDVIIVHGLWNYASFGTSLILPRLKVPYYLFSHGMMDAWFKKSSPIKHVLKQLFWLTGEGLLAKHARAVLFTSEDEKIKSRNVFFGHSYKELIIPYGTIKPPEESHTHHDAFTSRVPMLRGRRYILFLSRIHTKKGCDLLIKAFSEIARKYQDIDLVFAGPGNEDYVSSLKALASEMDVDDRIHWPGALFGDAKWGAMYGASAFVLPSHQENFGIAVAESLACGTPVLISNNVNIWREILSEGAGFVSDSSVSGCLQTIQAWLNLSLETQTQMRQNAKLAFERYFDVANTVPTTVSLLSANL